MNGVGRGRAPPPRPIRHLEEETNVPRSRGQADLIPEGLIAVARQLITVRSKAHKEGGKGDHVVVESRSRGQADLIPEGLIAVARQLITVRSKADEKGDGSRGRARSRGQADLIPEGLIAVARQLITVRSKADTEGGGVSRGRGMLEALPFFPLLFNYVRERR
ncbi:hypothetical protein CEXT_223921 [Caerostris extrusa]|uniref:Uncharacterized protein n=1 Tax=Caerostris extrusa TaxID=172846 RepID=A0AAV4MT92_CAEEX|nr:hypothetical protein CEXT_223921 [Caerostris extrusa]